ncbi:MAG TPA: hypothetical protein DEQ62_05560 [Verrucomicrobiales bacterium]|nr:hypothetical protein [Verrucomicrobiales bacterium]|tara:strand:+ start:148 stop:1434 length:1287 start_codon:yes stop_codon:yes gene_type:complete
MSLLDVQTVPRMFKVRQEFPRPEPLDISATVAAQIASVQDLLKPNARVAVTVGSRGIANLREIILTVLDALKAAGVQPFILPAMGSHGGATPEGQKRILADYGITEETMKVPIEAAMTTREVGRTVDGVPAFTSTTALAADGIVVLNRVKPHTDYFSRTVGSGLIKMMVVGMGKHDGAASFHRTAVHRGYEDTLRLLGKVVLREAPILFGLALVEHQYHDTARIEAVRPEDIESREAELLAEAAALLPKLPFDKADLLVVDQIGKNISGVGMDPNVIGRHAHHYSTLLQNVLEVTPFIRRIYVRGLTPETHGNAIGVGLADAVHVRLAEAMDAESTFVNVRTALTLHNAKLPMHFPNDRAAIAGLLDTLALSDPALARVMRIRNTLDLATLELSEAFAGEATAHENLTVLSKPVEWQFDTSGDLDALA